LDLNDPLDFAGLLCSRLCHDLISPVGAVGNGVELLQAVGQPGPDDVALIEQSARAAAAALAFFRIAFGVAGPGASPVTLRELGAAARAHLGGTRLTVDWPEGAGALSREGARVLLLMMLTCAGAAPLGGKLGASAEDGDPPWLETVVEGRRCAFSAATVAILAGAPAAEPLGPREAHLALLARAAARLGGRIEAEAGETWARLRFAPA
jgi:histidine phosphotransferase ChpT